MLVEVIQMHRIHYWDVFLQNLLRGHRISAIEEVTEGRLILWGQSWAERM